MRSPSCGYASTALNADFARLVSLACHDLRTPLATVQGFAKTMVRLDDLEEEKLKRYLGLIDSASDELAFLLDLLSLAARIEGDRYEPVTREADSLELARAAVPGATGIGASVQVEPRGGPARAGITRPARPPGTAAWRCGSPSMGRAFGSSRWSRALRRSSSARSRRTWARPSR